MSISDSLLSGKNFNSLFRAYARATYCEGMQPQAVNLLRYLCYRFGANRLSQKMNTAEIGGDAGMNPRNVRRQLEYLEGLRIVKCVWEKKSPNVVIHFFPERIRDAISSGEVLGTVRKKPEANPSARGRVSKEGKPLFVRTIKPKAVDPSEEDS